MRSSRTPAHQKFSSTIRGTSGERLDACANLHAPIRDDFAASGAETGADRESRRHQRCQNDLRPAAVADQGFATHEEKEITMRVALPWWTYSVAAYVVCIAGFMLLLVWAIAG